jgi:hypothetical protein
LHIYYGRLSIPPKAGSMRFAAQTALGVCNTQTALAMWFAPGWAQRSANRAKISQPGFSSCGIINLSGRYSAEFRRLLGQDRRRLPHRTGKKGEVYEKWFIV